VTEAQRMGRIAARCNSNSARRSIGCHLTELHIGMEATSESVTLDHAENARGQQGSRLELAIEA
jgi:hypothetical protein